MDGPGPVGLIASQLLERDAELQYLGHRVGDARDGRGGVVSLEGPAGIGKSALLAQACSMGRRLGLVVLTARGGELETGMAFGAARQLFEQAVFSMTPAVRRRVLAGPAAMGASALGLRSNAAPGDEFAALHGLYRRTSPSGYPC